MGNVDPHKDDTAPMPPGGLPVGPAVSDLETWDQWFPPEAADQRAPSKGGLSPFAAQPSASSGFTSNLANPQPVPARPIPARPIAARPIPAQPVKAAGAPVEPLKSRAAATAGPLDRSAVPRPGESLEVVEDAALPEDDAASPDEEDAVDAAARKAPPWLVSTLLHMLILIVLGLMDTVERKAPPAVLELDVLGDSLGDELLDASLDISAPTLEPELEAPALALVDLPEIVEPLPPLPQAMFTPQGSGADRDLPAPSMGYALSGRDPGRKKILLGKYGGDDNTEQAVRRALVWLKRNQKPDGSWSLTGPYQDGADTENKVAATAMALLAFQGAGHTHQQGEYQPVVDKGWRYLLKMQNGQGLFTSEAVPAFQLFYTHGQATIAVCEAYGMTRDPRLRAAAERAVQYCIRSQSAAGGWRYAPKVDSDTSVTGWILMGLQSAKMSGIEVPQETFDNISRFLDSVAREGGTRYVYQAQDQGIRDPTMTAEALLCRQYLGWERSDERMLNGVAFLVEHPIGASNHDVYYWYYATQVCHHMEGDAWKRWNEAMRVRMPEMQVKSGPETGSWNSRHDEWGYRYGRLYQTCLSTYVLEVYYRHLPIYTNVFEKTAEDVGSRE